MFERAVVNEPSVFEPLEFYCNKPYLTQPRFSETATSYGHFFNDPLHFNLYPFTHVFLSDWNNSKSVEIEFLGFFIISLGELVITETF